MTRFSQETPRERTPRGILTRRAPHAPRTGRGHHSPPPGWPAPRSCHRRRRAGLPPARAMPCRALGGHRVARTGGSRARAAPRTAWCVGPRRRHHARPRHPNALPLLMTHGWPGSVFELLKTIGPLTDPTAHGGRAEDAFDLVLPSMPGYGFSEKPKGTGWSPDRIARAWDVLMTRLGSTRYVAQGG